MSARRTVEPEQTGGLKLVWQSVDSIAQKLNRQTLKMKFNTQRVDATLIRMGT
jgi:hypothetical protein